MELECVVATIQFNDRQSLVGREIGSLSFIYSGISQWPQTLKRNWRWIP